MDTTDNFPTLEADLKTLTDVLDPAFERADAAALRFQKRFHASELVLIFGPVAAIVLGALAAAQSPQVEAGSQNIWAVAGTFLTLALGALAFVVRQLRWHERWLGQRTVAETLRSEQFLFHGRIGSYTEADDVKRALEARILDIERTGGNNDG